MDAIMAIAKKHDLFVIEDNCQAVGSDYTFAGRHASEGRNHRAHRHHELLPQQEPRLLRGWRGHLHQ